MIINSFSNKKIQVLRKLAKSASFRKDNSVIIIEGIRSFLEVPKNDIKEIFITEKFYDDNKESLNDYIDKIEPYFISEELMDKLSNTMHSQGIISIVKMPELHTLGELNKEKHNNIIVLEGLQDPGNLGTILRTALATGFSYAIIDKKTVDPFNLKVIRSSMGAIFMLPIIILDDIISAVNSLRDNGWNCYSAVINAKKNYIEEDYTKPSLFIIGNEGKGLSDELIKCVDNSIYIPMKDTTESLNAGVAASILMYEAFRQRNFK